MLSKQNQRQRLASLKKITQALKQTSSQSDLDYDYIKNLVNATQFNITQKSNINNDDKVINKQKLIYSLYPHDQQLIDLRQQNSKLQNNLKQLRDKIIQLQGQKRLLQNTKIEMQQKQKNKIPCFLLNQNLQSFVCRYKIQENDYDLLDFKSNKIQLLLDKIKIKNYSSKQEQQFQLDELIQVKYYKSIVLLQFQQFLATQNTQKQMVYVFLRFSSQQYLHKWDLGIYINFMIISTMNKPSLFQKYYENLNKQKQKQYRQKILQKIKSSNEINEIQLQKFCLQQLKQTKKVYQQFKSLMIQKLPQNLKQKINLTRKKLSNIQQIIKNKQEQQIKDPKIKQMPLIQSKVVQVKQIKNDIKLSQTSTIKQNKQPSIITLPYDRLRQQSLKKQTNVQFTPISSIKNSGTFPINPPPQRSLRISSAISIKSISPSKIHLIKSTLQAGFYATKYSKDGFSPHEKKIFLSSDAKRLCWSQRGKQSDYKSIPLQLITKIVYGTVGEGVLKHMRNPDERYHCLIQYFADTSKTKTIQLGNGNIDQMKTFCSSLEFIVKSMRK